MRRPVPDGGTPPLTRPGLGCTLDAPLRIWAHVSHLAPLSQTSNPVTDFELAPPANDTWEGILENLRRRYPGQKDSVLFCIYKLQQNPELTLRDFRDEAALHGIPMAGRALHSAKDRLGLLKPAPAPRPDPAPIAQPAPPRRRERAARSDDGDASIENRVMAAVRQIQSAAGADAEQLRSAMRKAITILQQALDGA